MARTIENKTQRLRCGSMSKTEDEEGDQWNVPDEEINLLDNSKEKYEGRVTSANAGA